MPVVWTIEEKCKRCYSCIRECPAKAIKVEKGQAKVIQDRCIGCGHCVSVCSQKAKAVLSGIDATLSFLNSDSPTFAMLAPAFPAAFPDVDPGLVVGALKALGFSKVVEVAFGADLINRKYKALVSRNEEKDPHKTNEPVITSSCPAICEYIQKYVPELISHLAPIVSPMVAMGRVVKMFYGDHNKVVFIGPCSAKKVEMLDEEVKDSVDEVLTFTEIEKIFVKKNIQFDQIQKMPFDPPHPYLGRLYPISGGLLRSAGLPFDIMNNDIILTEGKQRILNLLECIHNHEIDAKMVDVLFCEGCINGPYMNHSINYFSRKQKIVKYSDSKRPLTNYPEWEKNIKKCTDLPLTRKFKFQAISKIEPSDSEIRRILLKINKRTESDELNCGACGYASCREYATAVFQGLAEEEMCLPFLVDKQEKMQIELQSSFKELSETQEQLIHHEKLASIGQLAAGVAHEVNNPLGSIMLYAHLVLQKLGQDDPNASDLYFIMEEAKRCQKIVAGLLNFARQGHLKFNKQDIGKIIEKIINTVEKQKLFENIKIQNQLDAKLPQIDVDRDQIHQVFLNLIINAAEAMQDNNLNKKLEIESVIDTETNRLFLHFRDNGVGIPAENMGKLFTPFFTTKQIGEGTGLGLPIAYGIVKMHRGNISVKSEIGKGTTFTVELPMVSETFASQNSVFN